MPREPTHGADLVLVAPAPPPYGGQSGYSVYLRQRLEESGFVVSFIPLVTRDPRDGAAGLLRKLVRGVTASLALMIGPRRRRAFVVLDSGVGLLLDALLIAILRLKGARAVVSHHTFKYFNRSSRLFRLTLAAGGRGLSHAFLCGRMAELFDATYPGRAGQTRLVVSNCRRTPPQSARPDLRAQGQLTLGYISNIAFEKGIREFFELVSASNGKLGGVRGLLAGPATTKEVEAYVRSELAGRSGNVEWLGPVYADDKADFFRRLDFLVFPSSFENEAQPNVLFEALSFGVPVITLSRGCICEDLRSAGSLVVEDPKDFVAQGAAFLADVTSRDALAAHKAQAGARFAELRQESLAQEAALFESLRN
jgi:glycosyltransferase involved in cell wall biosynthesis